MAWGNWTSPPKERRPMLPAGSLVYTSRPILEDDFWDGRFGNDFHQLTPHPARITMARIGRPTVGLG